jgi:hypothetical protein
MYTRSLNGHARYGEATSDLCLLWGFLVHVVAMELVAMELVAMELIASYNYYVNIESRVRFYPNFLQTLLQ